MPTVAEMLYGKPCADWKPNTKYLYTVATVNRWTHAEVRAFIKMRFGVDSTKDLTWQQYQETLETFDTFSKAEDDPDPA